MFFVVLVAGFVAVYLFTRSRRDTGRAPAPELDALGWVAGTNWRVVGPLARVETRRLLAHPGFLGGIALTLLTLTAATSPVSAGEDWVRVSSDIALGLAPLGWFSIAAVQLLTTRARRTGADGLLASLPAPQPPRTAALLATMLGAAAVAALLAAAFVVYRARSDWVLGPGPAYAEILAGLLLVAGAVAVGVAIGRYLPHPMFGLVGAIVVIGIQGRFGTPTQWPWNDEPASPVRMLTFLAMPTSVDPALEYRPAGWHLLYLAGLTGVMALVALARNGVTRRLAGGLTVAVLAVGLAGWMQTRPAPASTVAAMVRYLEEPAARLDCVERDAVRYCVGERGTRALPVWQARVAALRALAPAGFAGRTLAVTERAPTVVGNESCNPQPFSHTLPTQVAATIDPAKVWPDDGGVHPGTDTWPCSNTSVRGFFFATQVGSWAVGLPPSPHGLDRRCRADGQARAVLALWMAATVTPNGRQTLVELMYNEPGASHLGFADWNDPPMWGVEFAVRDADLALRLLSREVTAERVRDSWDRLVDPSTGAAELAALVGLPTSPSPAVGAAAGRTCG